MRVTLLHNLGAGHSFSLEGLTHELERQGHVLVKVVDNHANVAQLHQPSIDAVVVAGGDATVATAVFALTGHRTPLAILPLGTANNISQSLGIQRAPLPEMIARWATSDQLPIDTGVVAGRWGETVFVEGVGGGLVADAIACLSSSIADAPPDRHVAIKRALEGFRHTLAESSPKRWVYYLDGQRFDEELLLFEVMNMRSVGPLLQLSSHVDPADGFLSVVTAGEEQRADLDRYFLSRIDGTAEPLDLPVQRAERVDIDSPLSLHIDDGIRRISDGDTVSLHIKPASFIVLR